MTLLEPTTQMLARLDALRANPTGRTVGVLGLGVAGRAMALHLVRRGARVIGADRRADLRDAELLAAGIELRLGAIDESTFADVEALVITPGADPRQPAVQAVWARGVAVLGELELVGKLPAKVVGITGTNGKSTTTALIGELARGLGWRSFVGGNFGEPVVSWVDRGEAADVLVLELSSYQLETAYRFCADVAVVLNVTPDHLDRYESVSSYARAKARLLANMDARGIAVLNDDDPYVRDMAGVTHAQCWWLSTKARPQREHAAWLDGTTLRACGAASALDGFDLRHPRLLGRHNRENAIAALMATLGLAGSQSLSTVQLRAAYVGFGGLAHRLEIVADVGGVLYVNDSKATNDDAAAVALGAMDRPTLLLVGGRDKGGGYARLATLAAHHARLVIAYGEARPQIVRAFASHPGLRQADGFDAALSLATHEARSGEAVLLAPACSSFDEFTNYVERGERFRAQVRQLERGGT